MSKYFIQTLNKTDGSTVIANDVDEEHLKVIQKISENYNKNLVLMPCDFDDIKLQ